MKPQTTVLYCKAGPDGRSLGDCPFTHSVQMALTLKGVKYETVPCTKDTKPSWLLNEAGGEMPCLYHEGIPHTDDLETFAFIDGAFSPSSLATPRYIAEKVDSLNLFPAIARFTKNTDDSKDPELLKNLQTALKSLGLLLECSDFLAGGPGPTLVDCDVLPKLYVLSHATTYFKNFRWQDLEGEGSAAVKDYYARGSDLLAFQAGKYPGELGLWGWGGARGLSKSECEKLANYTSNTSKSI